MLAFVCFAGIAAILAGILILDPALLTGFLIFMALYAVIVGGCSYSVRIDHFRNTLLGISSGSVALGLLITSIGLKSSQVAEIWAECGGVGIVLAFSSLLFVFFVLIGYEFSGYFRRFARSAGWD